MLLEGVASTDQLCDLGVAGKRGVACAERLLVSLLLRGLFVSCQLVNCSTPLPYCNCRRIGRPLQFCPQSTMELTQLASCSSNAPVELETKVVVIGNGPAGLSLSAFLSGWTPFYNDNNAHPNARLHSRLCKNLKESLLDQVYRLHFGRKEPLLVRG
ncbi:hypothetical protein L596_005470 [Steinernema carpocapsae]|uniref:FAD/NAD(P)-binding domain-containing protein n=1 Tax=Steinernema carpocapsae TaxID=34508 RepID=A0A4U8UZD0_STECR|nr:hypothetical protein L596_005470 [Steinernema carpocapsae]